MSGAFEDLVERAEPGARPYPYQLRIASDGLPEVLHAPTGSGKTMAAALSWLYRRRFHPDAEVRAETPRRLIFALPMRVLVEQTYRVIRAWLKNLELDESIGLHVAMGGEPLRADDWRLHPEREAIFIGTIDMLLSRALNRGYGTGRFSWPIDFALFNSGCQWVFDEVQLMGPALPTSRQLDGLREKFGTIAPCASMWMSATVEENWLRTYDRAEIGASLTLGTEDHTPELERRLDASKTVRRISLEPGSTKDLADALLQGHKSGSRTLAVFNTVKRAQTVHEELRKSGTSADVVLLHSRFRPPDRRERTTEAIEPVDPEGPGRIVVTTQVIEAGVDLSSTTLFTEGAPWPSIVQRAGRCNRYGEAENATLLWASPDKPSPYDKDDLEAAEETLTKLEGEPVTPVSLSNMSVRSRDPVRPVLRRRDLVGLFDTTPDLSGNDIDISRFIRDREEIDVHIAWRDEKPADDDKPTREELCPVPVGALRDELKKKGRPSAWHYDHIEEAWSRLGREGVRPGMIVALRAKDGRYHPVRGWDPGSKTQVESLEGAEPHPLVPSDEGFGDDPIASLPGQRVLLVEHLENVTRATRDLLGEIGDLLPPELEEALLVAAKVHDVGKAHEVFQGAVAALWDAEEREEIRRAGPWAKSGQRGQLDYSRQRRPHFRHELASALALLDAGSAVLKDVAEPDLIIYLVAAHHGRIRLGIRSLPDEHPPSDAPERRVALGIHDGDKIPEIEIPGGRLPTCKLDLSVMEMGSHDGRRSWTDMALGLRDREDLGPFRLAFLEAILRLADWKASRREAESAGDLL